ncbi:MAG TPA: helix-turn-helix transcriptional regulator [Blastocatellia bacterium]|nr:helix-turn-helix transcriptional regulator [Blastocatellia bacterium]
MNNQRRKKLEAAGWRVGNAADFLGLTETEDAFITVKLLLSRRLKEERERRKLTQKEMAERIHLTQSRIARMEASDREVTIDALLKALFATGVSRQEVAKTLTRAA